MMKTQSRAQKRYEVSCSPLYGLSNKRKLAELLGVDVSMLSRAKCSKLGSQYRIFTDEKTRRFITEPVGDLLLIHKRLLKLFCRIAPPDYIHSAIKKRSYKTNAEQHIGGENVLKIDIKKFFPSVKFHYIHNFFLSNLKCSPDIATLLARLCTVKTADYGVHLPTGSCISPILSFLANRGLFDAIKTLCDKQQCVFTLYVDDMTISGKNASRALLSDIAGEIHKRGYRYHKIETFHGTPATITGLVVFNGKLNLPHVRAKKIRDVGTTFKCAKGTIRQKCLASLVGLLAEAEGINPVYKARRELILKNHRNEWTELVGARVGVCQQ